MIPSMMGAELERRKVSMRAAMRLLLEGGQRTRSELFLQEHSKTNWTRHFLEGLDREGLILVTRRMGKGGSLYEVLDEEGLRALEDSLTTGEALALCSEGGKRHDAFISLAEARAREGAAERGPPILERVVERDLVEEETEEVLEQQDPVAELVGKLGEQLGAIATVLQSMDARLTRLEARPEVRPAEPPDLSRVFDRLDSVEKGVYRAIDQEAGTAVRFREFEKRHEVAVAEVRGSMSTAVASAESAQKAFGEVARAVGDLITGFGKLARTVAENAKMDHEDMNALGEAMERLLKSAGWQKRVPSAIAPVLVVKTEEETAERYDTKPKLSRAMRRALAARPSDLNVGLHEGMGTAVEVVVGSGPKGGR